MPATLKFPADIVRTLLAHAFAAPGHELSFEQRAARYGRKKMFERQPGEERHGKPGLWLVKDDGIYLMSNGIPALLIEDDKPDHVCAYAKGYDPHVDGDVWTACRNAVGGDDFSEWFDAQEIAGLMRPLHRFLIIEASDTAFRLDAAVD